MDNAFELYHERIIEAIRTGEVICLFFPRVGKTLILDVRSTATAGPAVFVENMVSSPRERLESLQRLRPEFPLPDELRLAPWLGFVRSIHDSGVYDALIERCEGTGDTALVQGCREAVRTIERTERELIRALVSGQMSRTIWQRKP